ncbi:MAG: tetratricopeptide repeat protein [Planctomycetota bacterium]|nr:tetratricopeptide repeat protein [Planctomycetota bacterium]
MTILVIVCLSLLCGPVLANGADFPLGELVSQLDSPDAHVVARAQATLDALDDSSTGSLKETLDAQISPYIRAILFQKLNTILMGMLAELDTAVFDFATARLQAQRASDDKARKSSARETARARVEKIQQKLSASGLYLGPALARHDDQRGTTVSLVLRVRERLRESLMRKVSGRWQQLPGADSLSLSDLRCLASLAPPRGIDPKWDAISERSARLAIQELESLQRSRISYARSWLLDLGAIGQRNLDEWSRESVASPVSPGIRQEWSIRNRLRIPAPVDLDSAISLANWDQMTANSRRDQLLQLRAVHGKLVTPTLVYLASHDPDNTVQRRCAEFLSLMGDPRGAKLLLAQRQFSSDQVEEVSRDAVLRASITLRDSGDLEGALSLLDDLSQRVTADAELHHAIGIVTMRMRNLERALAALQRALNLDPYDPAIHYNLACAHALSGASGDALEALERAIEAGYNDADHTRSDPDLESLRELPEFELLLDQMKGI